MAACVSVLNLKGGVGKTTIAAHVMRVLYHRHALKTLLVDLDPQFNLSQCLLTRKDYDHAIANGKSVFFSMEPVATSSLFDVSTTQKPPPDPMSICSGLRRYADDSVFLHPIPGDYRLIKYSLVSDTAKLASAKQRFLHFINLAKKQYDLVVIDCNPSSSFITMCALHACEHIIVPVRPDRYSILGLELVDKLLEEIPTINPRPDISVLLNGIKRNRRPTDVEVQLRAHSKYGPMVYGHCLYQSNLLLADQRYTGFATDRPVPYRELLKTEITEITDEIVSRLGIKK